LFFEQTSGAICDKSCFDIEGLDNTYIEMQNSFHNEAKEAGVKVVGGVQAGAGNFKQGRVNLFGMPASNDTYAFDVSNGARLLVQDSYHERGDNFPNVFMNLSGNSQFTLDTSKVALIPLLNNPAIVINNFHGKATFLNLSSVAGKFLISGDNSGGLILGSGIQWFVMPNLNFPDFLDNSTGSNALFFNNYWYTAAGGGSQRFSDSGSMNQASVLSALQDTRTQKPTRFLSMPSVGNVSDIRLYRVYVQHVGTGFSIISTTTPLINGGCDLIKDSCTTGTFSDTADSSTQYLWSCLGSNGGTTASCSLNIPVTPPDTTRYNNIICHIFLYKKTLAKCQIPYRISLKHNIHSNHLSYYP
jgi:hypothetical protein